MRPLRYQILRRLHCWLALPLALFLIVLGLTGSAITWMHELDVFLNPGLLQVAVGENETQPPATLLARLTALPGYTAPSKLDLPQSRDDVLVVWYKASKKESNQRSLPTMQHPSLVEV